MNCIIGGYSIFGLYLNQIDGSTLKTLCVQHGPLQNFHLYLNQGLALARYSTREEAAKARFFYFYLLIRILYIFFTTWL